MSIKPHPFQEQGVDKIERFGGRALLADDMGLGKTPQALWAARNLEAKLILVICPAMVKWNWADEARRFVKMRSEILETRTPPRYSRLVNPHHILIINYDILQYWYEYLKRLKPDMIIIDEAQNIKNPRAKRTKACRALTLIAEFVVALTGTPMWNRPIDLWSICNMIRPKKFPSFFKFAFKYTKPKRVFGHWEFKGARNLDQLRKRLRKTLMIRRLKSEVLDQLPPKVHSVIPLDIDNRSDYKLALNDFIGWLKKHFGKGQDRRKIFRALSMEQAVKLGYLKRLAAKGKMTMLIRWIQDFLLECDEKIILFGIHKFMIKGLREAFHNQAVVIDGSTKSKDRKIAVDLFRNQKKTRLMIGNLTAAGIGWNGTVASNVSICELPWVPAEVNQAIDRAHRIGQVKTVFARTLIAKGTIEENLCAMLQGKQQHAKQALDGDVGEDLNLMDQLSLALLRENR